MVFPFVVVVVVVELRNRKPESRNRARNSVTTMLSRNIFTSRPEYALPEATEHDRGTRVGSTRLSLLRALLFVSSSARRAVLCQTFLFDSSLIDNGLFFQAFWRLDPPLRTLQSKLTLSSITLFIFLQIKFTLQPKLKLQKWNTLLLLSQ